MTAFSPAVRFRRAALLGALCAGLAVAGTTGCGADPDEGTNGVGKLSADKIESKARAAATGADSVRLSGTVVVSGKTFTLDMRLKADGASGEVKSKDSTFQLLRLGETLYLKADAAFWDHHRKEGAEGADGAQETPEAPEPSGDAATAADKLGDKFVKVPEADASYKQLRGFTDMRVLLDGLLGLHGKLEKGAYTRVGNTRAIQVTGDKGEGGRLAVSLLGTPYPLRMERAGGAGVVELADWGQPFALEPPAKGDTVDYGSALPTG
ncbi:hypothetical protein [Streptomyces sp. NRRL S-87]|uniref:hypothetical protein n=1 Tax=Streptomyces sp. NRRL S-87 TaxID=1463920 RepID=UPI0004C0E19E|nr:hypothetical protein [Streptomyces sp. NRRL S-87]